MKIGKAALFASVVVFSYRLFKEVTGVRIKARTVVLEKAFLESLYAQSNFQALLFNHEYGNRFLAKDQVTLVAHILETDTGNKPMRLKTLESLDGGKPFSNELDYSSYRLEKDDIKTILDNYSSLGNLVYFLLEPITFSEDIKYLAYKILPADKWKQPIPFFKKVFQQQFAMAEATDMFGTAEDDRSSDDMGMRNGLRIDPSPPAKSTLSLF